MSIFFKVNNKVLNKVLTNTLFTYRIRSIYIKIISLNNLFAYSVNDNFIRSIMMPSVIFVANLKVMLISDWLSVSANIEILVNQNIDKISYHCITKLRLLSLNIF